MRPHILTRFLWILWNLWIRKYCIFFLKNSCRSWISRSVDYSIVCGPLSNVNMSFFRCLYCQECHLIRQYYTSYYPLSLYSLGVILRQVRRILHHVYLRNIERFVHQYFYHSTTFWHNWLIQQDIHHNLDQNPAFSFVNRKDFVYLGSLWEFVSKLTKCQSVRKACKGFCRIFCGIPADYIRVEFERLFLEFLQFPNFIIANLLGRIAWCIRYTLIFLAYFLRKKINYHLFGSLQP